VLSGRDLTGLAVSYASVLAVIGIGVLAARVGRARGEVTRKIVHVGVGTYVIPTIFLFDHGSAAAIVPASFVVINLLSRLFFPVAAVESGASRDNWGTVYFPVSFALLLLLFWEPHLRWCVAAGLLPMAWGDALAAEVGRRWGRHRYRVWGGGVRSLEGSVAMLLGSLAGVAVGSGLGIVAPGVLAPGRAVAIPMLAAVATAAEAVSPRGTDNLSVPLLTGAAAAALTAL
jgi:dolichol kinase